MEIFAECNRSQGDAAAAADDDGAEEDANGDAAISHQNEER